MQETPQLDIISVSTLSSTVQIHCLETRPIYSRNRHIPKNMDKLSPLLISPILLFFQVLMKVDQDHTKKDCAYHINLAVTSFVPTYQRN